MKPIPSVELGLGLFRLSRRLPILIGKPEVLCQLYGGFFLSQPIQGGGKINQDVYKRQATGGATGCHFQNGSSICSVTSTKPSIVFSYYRENSRMVRPNLNTTAEARVKGLVGLRDCVQELIDSF